MQNPSDANNERADKSVQFLESLVFEKDYEIFKNVRKIIIVNQFAFIQKHGFAGKDDQIGEENDRELTEAIKESDIVLIAWGKNNHFRDRKELVYSILTDLKDKTIYENKKHPSRGYYKDFIKAVEIVDLRT